MNNIFTRSLKEVSRYVAAGLCAGFVIAGILSYTKYNLGLYVHYVAPLFVDELARFGLTFWLFEGSVATVCFFIYLITASRRSAIKRVGFVENSIVFLISFLLPILFLAHYLVYWSVWLMFIGLVVAFLILFFIKEIGVVFVVTAIGEFWAKVMKFISNKLFGSPRAEEELVAGLDRPLINKADVDKIDAGSGYFSEYKKTIENTAELIKNCNVKESSYVIGIDANWGVGKTSFINIIKDGLKESTDVYWMEYEPWHFGNSDELISDFFKTLNQKIYKFYGISILSSCQLNKYIELLTPVLESTPWYVRLLPGVLKNLLEKDNTLSSLKKQSKDRLAQLPERLVIYLDDIDRMEPKEVLTTLKLVKLLSDFPNIVFILPFDFERIASLITDKFTNQYQNYLQKIIDRQISLDSYTYEQLLRIFEFHREHEPGTAIDKDIFDYFASTGLVPINISG